MALQPRISTCIKNNGCSAIILNETTGVYDVNLNPTGYGAPNIAVGDVTETHIYVTMPDGTVIDILNPTGLPTSDESLEYEITAAALDETLITDGLYIIEYTVTDGITVYSTGTKYFLYTCNVDCCVAKMFAKIATVTNCQCDDVIIKNALYASALLEGMKASANCGNTTNISKILTKLQSICGFTTTDCGCSN
jgi:hypothetical protein